MNKKQIKITVTIIACIAVLLAVAALVLNAMLPDDGKIASGVSIAGENVGGMTVEEAESLVADNDCYKDKTLVFIGEPDTEEISGDYIGLGIDSAASVQKAYNLCRDGSWIANAAKALKIRFGGADLLPVPTANEKLDEVIYQRGVRKNGEMQELRIEEISETEISATPGTSGQSKDVSESRAYVLVQIESGNTDGITLDLPASERKQMTAQELHDMIFVAPVNAEYSVVNNEMQITSEVVGRSADMTEIEQKIDLFNGGETITLAMIKTVPEVTAEGLHSKLFAAELASYSSKYSTAAANRAFNVSRAAASVNGTILMPGEVFSYNQAIGNPSLANGYKMASVYENGRQTEGVGGGVCQVSSTLYSAVLYANLEIVERRSHSLTVAYVPKGQDATVSYGSVDFKFRNNTENPIKIESVASGGLCKVRILGAKPATEQNVQIINTTVSVNQPTTNETQDPNLPQGTRKVTSSGKTGYVVESVRVVTENGKEIKREKLTKSTYKSVPTEVTVGTKAPPAPASTPASVPVPSTPTPTPTPTPAPTPEMVVPEPETVTDNNTNESL